MQPKTLNDKDLQKYYDEKLATYASPGWALLVEEMEEVLTQYRDIGSVTEKHTLPFRLGQVDILTWMLSQNATHVLALDSLLADEAAAADGDD